MRFAPIALLLVASTVWAAGPTRGSDPLELQSIRRTAKTLVMGLESLDFYGSQEATNLRFTLTNRSNQSVWVLRWELPGESMEAPLFNVTRDGETVGYEGPLVKRGRPEASDYLEIKAGATYAVVFDPSSQYDMHQQGNYRMAFTPRAFTVRYTAPQERREDLELSLAVRRDLNHQPLVDTLPHDRVATEDVPVVAEFHYQGAPGLTRTVDREMTVIGGYTKCTTTQQSTLKTAHADAITISGKALNQMNANPSGSTLHTYWFGTFDATRYATVKSHYTKINGAFVNQNVVYDCGCKKSAYAYVYSSQPYKIYLCKAFWTAPALGRDSKAGTLVHEMSHFTVNGGTTDYVYGATGAHNLALTDPAKAIMNADNHEYFAEDQQ